VSSPASHLDEPSAALSPKYSKLVQEGSCSSWHFRLSVAGAEIFLGTRKPRIRSIDASSVTAKVKDGNPTLFPSPGLVMRLINSTLLRLLLFTLGQRPALVSQLSPRSARRSRAPSHLMYRPTMAGPATGTLMASNGGSRREPAVRARRSRHCG
jgi:hypothetical protein